MKSKAAIYVRRFIICLFLFVFSKPGFSQRRVIQIRKRPIITADSKNTGNQSTQTTEEITAPEKESGDNVSSAVKPRQQLRIFGSPKAATHAGGRLPMIKRRIDAKQQEPALIEKKEDSH